MDPPAFVIPVMKARLELKYVAIMATLGMNKHPAPRPTQIPCANRI